MGDYQIDPQSVIIDARVPVNAILRQGGTMTQIDISPINQLCNTLGSLSREPIAPSREIADEWQANPLAHLKIRQQAMLPLPAETGMQVMRAMEVWQSIFVGFCLRGGTNAELLNRRVKAIRANLHEAGDEWRSDASDLFPRCEQVIWNISWVDAFAWQLPGAQPAAAAAFLDVGRTMASIMWVETVGKAALRGRSSAEAIAQAKQIDARFCIAQEQYDAVLAR